MEEKLEEIEIVDESKRYHEKELLDVIIIANRNKIILTFREEALQGYKKKLEEFKRFLEYED